jgi:hypothetical protein
MGSLALPRDTRFETTTRFTGSPPDGARVLTTIHQYGSLPTFQRNETKFGPSAAELDDSSAKTQMASFADEKKQMTANTIRPLLADAIIV